MAVFPALLHHATRSHGLMWYLAMIQGAKMQGPLGATSAFHSGTRNRDVDARNPGNEKMREI
jgi:hypothetical protein